jgi:hypothetical protein
MMNDMVMVAKSKDIVKDELENYDDDNVFRGLPYPWSLYSSICVLF